MTTLTRTGYLVDTGPIQEIKKELTVRPIVNGDFGFPPPPFKVFRPTKNGVCVPRFYGTAKLGEPRQDKRPNQPESRPNLWENSEILPTKMRHSQQQLKQAWRPFFTMRLWQTTYPWP